MKTNARDQRAKAQVYAEVLLEAVRADDRVLRVAGEFDELLAAVRGSVELRRVLGDKATPASTQQALLDELFGEMCPELVQMFSVMVSRGDLAVLARAYEAYVALAEEALGALIIDVTTVVALDDSLRQQIMSKYSDGSGRGVLLREHIDPRLIGGIVLSTHGRRIDASVSSQLEHARHVLAGS